MHLRNSALTGLVLTGAMACTVSHSPGAPVSAPERASDGNPRLVVMFVLDQLPSWSLELHREHLRPDGLIEGHLRDGATYPRVVLPYATTSTALGHVAIHSGATPSESGVMSNQVWNHTRREQRPVEDDEEHLVFGRSDKYASPTVSQAENVGDVLKRERSGAKVVSVSLKSRAAILSGGRAADMAVWYERKLGRFTTSTYYADAMPEWLEAFNRAHPVEASLETWEPLRAEGYPDLGPDDRPEESPWYGLARSFPHDARKSQKPTSTFRVMPSSVEALVALARAAVEHYELGNDAVPDLLTISVSTTDYVGHVFGPASWEYRDILVRVDAMLGELARELEARTDVAFLLTSDHGGCRLPTGQAEPDWRVIPDRLVEELDGALDDRIEPGDWVASYTYPFIYLSPTTHAHPRANEVRAAVRELLEQRPAIARVYDTRELEALNADDPLESLIRASMRPPVAGDFYVLLEENYLRDPELTGGGGSTHGTPWSYDREVPFFVRGPGVEPSSVAEPTDQRVVAATVSRLLGVSETVHVSRARQARPVVLARTPSR